MLSPSKYDMCLKWVRAIGREFENNEACFGHRRFAMPLSRSVDDSDRSTLVRLMLTRKTGRKIDSGSMQNREDLDLG